MEHPRKKPRKPAARKPAHAKPSAAELDSEIAAMNQDATAPGLIEGVYNYCDRWCERCPLTARCLLFRTSTRREAEASAKAETARDNEAFWNEIALSFAAAIRMVRRDAKKRGIDLDSPELQAEVEREEKSRRRAAARSGNEIHRAASAYWKAGQKLLAALVPTLVETNRALATEAELGIGQPGQTAASLGDALEIVEWYLFFVDVKLRRAVSSRVDERRDHAEGPKDSDGSAKIALIAIDRSIAAWSLLRRQFEAEHGDTILDLLVQLERLRRAVEAKFPHARAFRRPGWD